MGSSCFSYVEWPALALKAYITGKISRIRVSTLLLYDCCCLTYPNKVSAYQLVEQNGDVNFRYWEKFTELDRFYISLSNLKTHSKDALFERIKKSSPEQTQFFVHNRSILLSVELFGLMSSFEFPESGMGVNPVLGFSLTSHFARKTKRDVYVPCRYVTPPSFIHGEFVDSFIN